ncbi:hypothetical protein HY214_04465 [Candidatus Roizmanbacteria bacterium]|nr:hypothetical protein [Candidatus Roizmanbacteria bacterium]
MAKEYPQGIGPAFRERVIAARALLKDREEKLRSGVSPYPYIDGFHFDVGSPRFEELGKIQLTIVKHIRELAGNASIKRPVVYLDIGGGFGVSSIAIAIFLSDLVSQGKVVLIVSNLEFLPDRTNVSKLLRDDNMRVFLENNMHLVQYIKTDIGHIPNRTINVKNKRIKLSGNLDVVHEYNALTHSTTPDRDYSILGRSLSPWGSLILDSTDPYPYLSVPDNLRPAIAASFEIGINNLRVMSLRESRLDYYYVFQREQAPNITYASQG